MISIFDKPDTPHQAIFAVLGAWAGGYCTAAAMKEITVRFPRWFWIALFGAVNLTSWLRRYFV